MSNEATKDNIKSQRRDAKGKLLPQVRDTPIKPVVDALNNALRAAREQHAELPNVVLVVGASGYRSPSTLALGHFVKGSWDSKTAQHEIAISGECLKRGGEGVMETLLHELAHALGEVRDIATTSRQGRYHNKRFKALAEELGLVIPVQDSSIGWSTTQLTAETKKLYKTEIAELAKALKLYRIPITETKKKPKTTVKIECGCRSVTVPISFIEKGSVLCSMCGFELEPIDDGGWVTENEGAGE